MDKVGAVIKYFEGINKLEQRCRKCIKVKTILRNNGINSALDHSLSRGFPRLKSAPNLAPFPKQK